jgi:hypothetical protein
MKDDKLSIKDILKGAEGITKATLGIDKSTKELYSTRINICKKCPYMVESNDNMKCKECGCFLRFKARLNKEKCPLGKW